MRPEHRCPLDKLMDCSFTFFSQAGNRKVLDVNGFDVLDNGSIRAADHHRHPVAAGQKRKQVARQDLGFVGEQPSKNILEDSLVPVHVWPAIRHSTDRARARNHRHARFEAEER